MQKPQQQGTVADTEAPSRTSQQIMRAATTVILVAFVLIVVATTVSTGHFVQVLGKTLFYAIAAGAAVLLVTWLHRSWVERRGT